MKSLRKGHQYNRQMNAWILRRGEGSRFQSRTIPVQPSPEQIEAYWKEMSLQANRKAKAILGQEEYCRRIDILWPDDSPRSWEESARINRAILDDPRWVCSDSEKRD